MIADSRAADPVAHCARWEEQMRHVDRRSFVRSTVGALAATRFLAAFGANRVLGALLFGVRPTDPRTLAAGALVLLLVATVATFVPAHRATRVDPASGRTSYSRTQSTGGGSLPRNAGRPVFSNDALRCHGRPAAGRRSHGCL